MFWILIFCILLCCKCFPSVCLDFSLVFKYIKFCLFACLLVFWCSQIYLSFPPWFELLSNLFKKSFPSPSSWRDVGRHLNILVFLFIFNYLIYLEIIYLFLYVERQRPFFVSGYSIIPSTIYWTVHLLSMIYHINPHVCTGPLLFPIYLF